MPLSLSNNHIQFIFIMNLLEPYYSFQRKGAKNEDDIVVTLTTIDD